jgi:WD40 repeat protein
MKPRPDLLPENSPPEIEVFQLTEEAIPSCHVYMEAQIFAPDSKRFILHRSAHAHGSNKDDPEHRYLLCDLEDGGALRPITEETGATAPSLTPDGKSLYYFVNETVTGGGRLILKRVGLDGTGRETVMVIDAPLPGTKYRPSKIYPLSTISSDGKRLAQPAFLGDGKMDNAPFGLMVFDLEKATVELILEGPSWINLHPQYSRSTDPEACHDILVQENHGCTYHRGGGYIKLTGGAGADIHVIRDDGTNFRDLPWGRDGIEFCQGHQCWRGRSTAAITSTSTRVAEKRIHELVESDAVPHVGHEGLKTPGGRRNILSRDVMEPHFYHFATGISGKRFITDDWTHKEGCGLCTAEFSDEPDGPLKNWKFILNTRVGLKDKRAHVHPFLSPDGTKGFFNSDEAGDLQAYMVTGLFAG